jgi:putative hydrolase of HD superfamily
LNKIIEKIFSTNLIYRWSELPRPIEFKVSDRESMKAMIAFLLSGYENNINYNILIKLSLASIFRKSVITDIKNSIYEYLVKENVMIDEYVFTELKKVIDDDDLLIFIKNYDKFETKEKELLDVAGLIATEYELKYIKEFDADNFEFKNIYKSYKKRAKETLKNKGYRKFKKNKKIKKLIDIINALRFQKRGSRVPIFPNYSVLSHMYFVAIINYFLTKEYINKNKIIDKTLIENKLYNNFYTSLFHDLLESLTRDIISPLKQKVDKLDNVLEQYEHIILKRDILPVVPKKLRFEFEKFLIKPFSNKLIIENYIEYDVDDDTLLYNNGIDGKLLKVGDDLTAFYEILKNPYTNFNEELKLALNRIVDKYKNVRIYNLDIEKYFKL